MNEVSSSSSDVKPQAMLILSRALSASRPSLIAFLVAKGAELSGGVADPISFCNILFVGNLCAALTVGMWFGFRQIINDLKTLQPKVLIGLLINGLLATVLATLIFIGLQYTTVTNAVLLGRLGPVLFALLGALLLGRKIQRLEWFGFSLIAVGVVAIALKTSMFQINRGDLLILLSTIVFAISSLVNKLMVAKVAPLSSVVFSRNLLSSVIFFFIAMRLFGPDHFGHAFSGRLWIIMSVYSLIVIVFAQFLWYGSVGNLDSTTIGRLTVLSPIFGITYAFVLNGERPSGIQVGTLIIIIIGVLIASFGSQKKKEPTTEIMMSGPENAASAP
ncbi:MAG: DMT family transporter [Cyanothece sp. SIO2G6]|nr:DMT family transporter [Cyanothece sp. SIO2G6]